MGRELSPPASKGIWFGFFGYQVALVILLKPVDAVTVNADLPIALNPIINQSSYLADYWHIGKSRYIFVIWIR